MNHLKPLFRRSRLSLLMAGSVLCAGSALAAPVSMPTPEGHRDFDSRSFANAIQADPTGEFACFARATLSACTATSVELGALGSDLSTGLTLGFGASVTLALPATAATGLALWEAGTVPSGSDATETYVAVHTAAGWSIEQGFGTARMAPVQNDPRASGYQTNFGTFSVADFGLATGTVVDAVRIRSGDAQSAHLDILAISVDRWITPVPEPKTSALLLAGLLGVGLIVRRRMSATGAPTK
jgi:hypothetical protein